MTLPLNPGIEFCICTFNRVEFLKINITALLPQLVHGRTMITIVDNNSSDGTKEYIHSLIHENDSLRYVTENIQGLSSSRNRGWKESKFEWIFYIDDDCVPPQGFISEALILIDKHNEFDALGGPIDPLFIAPPPAWLPEGFGSFSMAFDKVTKIEKGYIRGGCFLIKKNVLEALGGFNPALGMTGKSLRYAEELALQNQMHKAGYHIGYAPSLRINHYVRNDKINLGWILRSEYARRRDKVAIDSISIISASLSLIRTLAGRLIWIPIHFITMCIRTKYTWHQFILDSLLPLAFRTGALVGAFKYRSR